MPNEDQVRTLDEVRQDHVTLADLFADRAERER